MSDDQWVPVCLEADVPRNSAHPVLIGGKEVVIWRASGDSIHAWEDRCPHRGMRLSFGFVRGDRLVCLYHGWEYGEGGNCQRIPAHPDLEPPATICSTAYAVRQDGGVVFVNLSGEDAPWNGDTGTWTPVRSIYVGADMARVRQRLADGETALGNAGETTGAGSLVLTHPDHGRLRIALQDCGDGRTGVHVTSESSDPATTLALASLTTRARRELETT